MYQPYFELWVQEPVPVVLFENQKGRHEINRVPSDQLQIVNIYLSRQIGKWKNFKKKTPPTEIYMEKNKWNIAIDNFKCNNH